MKRIHRGQSLSEYSVLLAIAFIAIVAMNVYVKRGLQGRYADVVDNTTARVSPNISQYEPYYVESATTVEAPRKITAGMKEGKARRDLLTDAGPTRVNSTNLEKADVEGWKGL